MAGVYEEGWGYAAIVALGIVLAAMYVLRLISAVLHVKPGAAVRDEALDLRPGELALVVPLVLCLLALSVWPALVSQSSFPNDAPAAAISEGSGDRRPRTSTGSRSRPRSRCSRASGVALLGGRPRSCVDAEDGRRRRGVRGLRRRSGLCGDRA